MYKVNIVETLENKKKYEKFRDKMIKNISEYFGTPRWEIKVVYEITKSWDETIDMTIESIAYFKSLLHILSDRQYNNLKKKIMGDKWT